MKFTVNWTEEVRYEAEIEADTYEQAIAGFSMGLETDIEEVGSTVMHGSIEIRSAK